MSNFGTFTPSTTSTLPLNYIPQFFEAEQDANGMSALVIEADDIGTIVNLDTVGINSFGQTLILIDAVDSSPTAIKLRLTNGKIPLRGNSCRFKATCGTTGVRAYQESMAPQDKNPVIFRKLMSQALANSETVFDNFTALGLANLSPTDLITIGYRNGHVEQNLAVEQLGFMYGFNGFGTTDELDLATPGVTYPSVIGNYEGDIEFVSLICGAATNIYVERMVTLSALK